MKKKIALIILLALACTLLLASCAQATPTKTIPRWSIHTEDETYVYNVELADFATSGDTRFAVHADKDIAYYKDFAISATELMDGLDQVRPKAVSGTYSITISYDSATNCNTVVTAMEVTATYEYKDGKIKVGTDVWHDLIADIANSDLVVTKDSNTITLKSTTETMVEFKYVEKQTPYKSSTKVDGFYIGATHQEKSKYEVATTYNYEGKNAVAKVTLSLNGGEPTENEYTLKRYSEGTFIDSNQLFTYTRSFDKTSSSFADRPAVAVYNPMSHEMQTASFTFTSSVNAMLTNDNAHIYTKLPVLGVSVDSAPFMVQIAAPNMLDKENKGPDRAQFGTVYYAKHTPLRFRVGYMSFELSYQTGAPKSQELWNALYDYTNKKD